MKKTILILVVAISSSIFAQNKADDITGIWYMHKSKDGSVTVAEIFKHTDGKYYAYGFDYKVKGSNTQMTDSNNPDPALRNVALSGITVVYGLSFDGKEWKNGYIYNPENGKTYNLQVKMKDKNTLTLRASIDGSGVFGATMEWTRTEANNTYKPLDKSSLRFLNKK